MRDIFGLTAPVSGGRFTVNVAGVSQNPKSLNQSTFGPSYRGIFDMSDLDKSLFIQPTGQSGNPLSKHYGDLFDIWRNVEYFEIPTATTVPANVDDILYLKPDLTQNQTVD
jgi:penicillin amidase